MALPDIFSKPVADQVIDRINKLAPDTPAGWGKMSVDQMLAHCNVTYEMVYDTVHPKPGGLMKLILKLMVKNKVVNEAPYPKNNPTAPQFMIRDRKDFAAEKERLIAYIGKTQQLGKDHFEGKESHSFGPLNTIQWNNMFYKHLDHHLTQFGV